MATTKSRFNRRLIISTISTILLMEGLAMIPSVVVALMDGDKEDLVGMTISAGILLILSIIGHVGVREFKVKMKVGESYLVVLLAWMAAVFGGMLPYLLAGQNIGPVDAFFESAASWTTTNAWVVDINELPRALVLWKAISNWLGGMGIIVLTIVIFSALGVNGQKLVGVEIAGPQLEKHTARMADTAKLLYMLYGVASLVETVLLCIAGVPLFHAIINTMSTISTSGTMDYQGVLSEHFTSPVKVIVIIFSLFATVNFAIYIKVIRKKFREAFMDFELHVFFGIIVAATILIGIILWTQGYYDNVPEAVINALTGVVSFSCTTGFPLEHVELWPSICKFIFVILMMIGGCATSTAGGLKVIRFAVFVKLIFRGIYKRIHPRAVKPVMIRDVPVSTANASSISTFILLFFGVYLISTLIISLENFDMETTLTAPIALFTNCGVGFGQAFSGQYDIFSMPGRFFCAFLMILGRLEMYALLILFSRSFWNPHKTT